MVHEFIMEAIRTPLEDYGVDWILNEKYPNSGSFNDLLEEIELALGKVLERD